MHYLVVDSTGPIAKNTDVYTDKETALVNYYSPTPSNVLTTKQLFKVTTVEEIEELFPTVN